MLATPPLSKRGHSWPGVANLGPLRSYVHAFGHTKTTPGCGRHFPQFSAASATLSTPSTPYVGNNRESGKEGAYTPVSDRDRFQGRGVDTPGVDTAS